MRLIEVATLLDKDFLCLSGIILTHFKVSVVIQSWMRNQVAARFWPCTL